MLKSLLFNTNTPRWLIYLIDLAIVVFAIFLAYMLRFNFSIPESEYPFLKYAIPTILLVRGVSFLIGKPYAAYIRYTSVADATKILVICFIGSIIITGSNVISYSFKGVFNVPFSIVILEFLITSFVMVGSRSFVKLLWEEYRNPSEGKSPVLIFGAGEAGMIAKRAIDKDAKSDFYVVGFIDDNQSKTKRRLENKPIFHASRMEEIFKEKNISHLIVSAQQIKKSRRTELIKTCLDNYVQVLNVPQANKWINGELSLKQMRKVKIEDLLGRESIEISKERIQAQLNGKVVLITGAAGSIGSEVVRQVIQFSPQKVLLVDQAESALYELEMELSNLKEGLATEVIISDICNAHRMERVFQHFKPEIVFHAAAYKHVPLMENNPSEAILTNVQGSKLLADLANQYEVGTFVMISTDKAVNPTNVMGASKRIAEIYTQALNKHSSTKFITTRFGNVLGSNGSVIPLFRKQIEKGGPITVTDPEITRFFMTIPEACQLVLEAGASGKGGEIFIFDMGKSVKIKDLASEMIKLSGLEEGKDIQIVYTGLRPGEKLYEELLNKAESTTKTHHPDIMIAQVQEYAFDEVKPKVEELISSINLDDTTFVSQMKGIVPEYKSNNSKYESLD